MLSVRVGWLGSKASFAGVRVKAERLGTAFITDRVVDLRTTGALARAALPEFGRSLNTAAWPS